MEYNMQHPFKRQQWIIIYILLQIGPDMFLVVAEIDDYKNKQIADWDLYFFTVPISK